MLCHPKLAVSYPRIHSPFNFRDVPVRNRADRKNAVSQIINRNFCCVFAAPVTFKCPSIRLIGAPITLYFFSFKSLLFYNQALLSLLERKLGCD